MRFLPEGEECRPLWNEVDPNVAGGVAALIVDHADLSGPGRRGPQERLGWRGGAGRFLTCEPVNLLDSSRGFRLQGDGAPADIIGGQSVVVGRFGRNNPGGLTAGPAWRFPRGQFPAGHSGLTEQFQQRRGPAFGDFTMQIQPPIIAGDSQADP